MSGVLQSHGIDRTTSEVLSLFSGVEPKVQSSGSFIEYREVLRQVMALIGGELGFRCTGSELSSLSDTLPVWPVFSEAPGALKALKRRFKLAVISNVDDGLFAGTAEALGVQFDAVVTSQQVRSYKPDLRNFNAAASRMAVAKEAWLHVAESLYHDIAPANRLGIASVWVSRPDRGGGSRSVEAEPDLVVPDLAALARLACPS